MSEQKIPKAVDIFWRKFARDNPSEYIALSTHTASDVLLTHPDSPVKQALDAAEDYLKWGSVANRTNLKQALAALEEDK